MGKKRKAELISSGMDIPDYVIESIARSLLPVIRDYYETDEGQRSFKEWQERQKDIMENKSSG